VWSFAERSDKRLTDKINIPFNVVEDPLHAVARGTGVALKMSINFRPDEIILRCE